MAGRSALRALADWCHQRGLTLFHLAYGSRKADGTIRSDNVHYHFASSKWRAVVRAVSLRSSNALIVFWHRKLLKLYPFMAGGNSTAVLFMHGIEVWREFDWFNAGLFRQVDHFLSNSAFTWKKFIHHNPRYKDDNHRVVHLGLGNALEDETPPPREPPTALMLGRLSRRPKYNKGHESVIRTWPRVLDRVPGADLWIAGKKSSAGDLEQLVDELGLSDHVTFWGWVSENRKEELIAQSSCLALPSRGEGFGLVYLEAMRLGRPCLVSTVDAGEEVVNPPEAGLSVDPVDHEALAEALHQLMVSDETWQQRSTRARRRYERLFTGDAFRERFIRVLLDVIE